MGNIFLTHKFATFILQNANNQSQVWTPGQALDPNFAASCGVLWDLCCAGLFNLPIPLRCAFGMGVSQ